MSYYLSLNHKISLLSQFSDKVERINHALFHGSLQLYINGDQSACPAHTSTGREEDGIFNAKCRKL